MYPNGNNNGRRALSPLILYGAVAVALLFALYLLISLFTAGFDKHFALVAGALLLLINARELLGGLTPFADRCVSWHTTPQDICGE
jgi:hypothetical protein